MFHKVLALLFFVSAVTAQLQDGLYRIFNAQSGTTVRSNAVGAPLFVSTDPIPVLYELWVVRRIPRSPPNIFTMKNIGLDAWAADPTATSDQFLTTSRDNPSSYFIESTDNVNYVISNGGHAAVWNAELPLAPRGNIKLQAINGNKTQVWQFKSAVSA